MAGLLAVQFVALCLNSRLSAQSFERTYGFETAFQTGTSIAKASDGGFILVGSTVAIGASVGITHDMYAVRIDPNGDTLWTRSFGGAALDQSSAVQMTSDRGFLIAGTTGSFGSNATQVYLVRTDMYGTLLWSKTYGGIGNSSGNAMLVTPDDGAVIAGASGTANNPDSAQNTYVIRTDAYGDTLWTRTFDDGNDNLGYAISAMSTGGYVVAGMTKVAAPLEASMELIRLDDSGGLVWNKTIDLGLLTQAYWIGETSDGGLIATGLTIGGAFLMKLTADGDPVWSKLYHGFYTHKGYCVREMADGDFVVSGFNYVHTWLFRTNAQGSLLWEHSYSEYVKNTVQFVVADDGGFALAANCTGTYTWLMQLVRTATDGTLPCESTPSETLIDTIAPVLSTPVLTVATYGTVGTPPTEVSSGAVVTTVCNTDGIEDRSGRAGITVYPDPATERITVRTGLPLQRIELIDVSGRPERSLNWIGDRTLDLAGLAPGHYLLRCMLSDGGYVYVPFVRE